MASKHKRSFSRFILDMLLLVPNLMSVVRHTTALIKSEARLAVKNIISLVLLAVVGAILLAWTWLGLLAILFTYLLSLQWSSMAALAVLVAINFVLLLIILWLITRVKNKLFHSHRSSCKHVCRRCEDEE